MNSTETRFSKNLAKSALWSGSYKCWFQFYPSERLETWNPVNLVKSCDLVRILWAVLYFTNQLFWAFYKLFTDINLKFSGFLTLIWTILQNFVMLAWLEVAFPKIEFFWILFCHLQIRPNMLSFFLFCSSLWVPTSVKNFIVIDHFIVIFRSQGFVFTTPSPDGIKLLEKADAINREVLKWFIAYTKMWLWIIIIKSVQCK